MKFSKYSISLSPLQSLIEKETHKVGLKMTTILNAVKRNNYHILKLLLKLNSGLKQRDLDLALLHAAKAGLPECTEILVTAGANVNARDAHDDTPLTHASENGNYRILKLLITAGADVKMRDGSRGNALHHAAKWGFQECVELLLTSGTDCNVQDGLWHTPLMLTAKHAEHPHGIIRMLVDAGTSTNIMGTEQRTVLHLSAIRGLDIQPLLNADADPHLQDAEGNSALHYAAMEGHLLILNTLLTVNCDPNMANYQRRTPVHFAAMKGNEECLKELISALGNPFLTDSAGNLPMWYCAVNGHFRATRLLVQLNSPLSLRRSGGQEVRLHKLLQAILETENLALVKLLVIGGCDTKPFTDWLMLTRMRPSLWSDANAAHLVWLKNYVLNPKPLGDLCRLAVRKQMGIKLKDSLTYLPLPQSVKYYLAMKELDYWSESACETPNQWVPDHQKLNLL